MSIEIPYYYLGIAFLIVLAIFFVMAFFNLFHIFKFGLFDFTGKLNACIFCSVWAIILFFTILFLWQVNWLDYFDIIEDIFL